jgi:radical SAM superfamily enzyme YgiQ (UPF0313 family)
MSNVIIFYPSGGISNDLYSASEVGQISSVLKESGFQTKIIRTNKDDFANILNLTSAFKPACIVAVLHWESPETHIWLRALIEAISKLESDVPLICQGITATCFPDELLTHYPRIDSLVLGDAEETIGELIQCMLEQGDIRQIPGIAYRDATGVHTTGYRIAKRCMDNFPMPDTSYFTNRQEFPILPIYSSRGCLYNCSFCPVKVFDKPVRHDKPYRVRSPKRVVDELAYLHHTLHGRIFYFIDSCFLINEEKSRIRALEIAQTILERGLKIHFYIETRVDAVDISTFKKLKQAGLRSVLLGIENGSQSVLDRYHKGTTVMDNIKAINTLQSLGINIEPGFIMFDPYTNYNELKENLDFLSRTKLYRASPSILYRRLVMYPKSPFFKRNIGVIEEDNYLMHEGFPTWRNQLRYYKIIDPVVRQIEYTLLKMKQDVANLEEQINQWSGLIRLKRINNRNVPNNQSDVLLSQEMIKKIRIWKQQLSEMFFRTFKTTVLLANDIKNVQRLNEACEEIYHKELEQTAYTAFGVPFNEIKKRFNTEIEKMKD